MKFLLTTYSTAFLASGGGESELVQMAEILSQGGARADIYGIQSRPLDYYDAVMHFSVQPDGWLLFDTMVERGSKVLLWPNVWWRSPPSAEEVERIARFVARAHKLVFKSLTEQQNFLEHLSVPPEKLLVAPSCVSPGFAMAPDPGLAKTVCDLDAYVLCLGRIEPVKNQLTLIRALKQAGLQGLMVGGHNDSAYFNACRREAGDAVQFLPFVKPASHLLLSLMAGADLVAEPCFDPAGRSSLEAALLNKPLVLAADAWVDEHFGDTAFTTDPTSLSGIVNALQRAAQDPDGRVARAHARIVERHASPAAIDRFVSTLIGACDD